MHLRALALSLLTLLAPAGRAQVQVNEVMSAGSDRMLRWTAGGVPKLGFGSSWYEASYSDANWFSGNGPFGFGTFPNVAPTPAFGTDTSTQMRYLTPTLYLRKTFTASAAQAGTFDVLELVVQYNDGFVAYLNGVEIARRNAWASGQFIHRDQPAANGSPGHGELNTNPGVRSETINLGQARLKLVTGANVLAIHALNHWETSYSVSSGLATTTVNNKDNFFLKGDLRIGGAFPSVLVANNSAWKYFPGVTEPSGGVLDPSQLFSARRRVEWGDPSFADGTWASGPAPIGAGTPPSGTTLGTNVGAQMIGITPSLYARTVFSVTSTDLADIQPLQLQVGFDDGFVAYLNGLEVARANLGPENSFVPHTAVATAANGSPQTYVLYNLEPPAKLLKEGLNVLSIQVHNVAVSDADLFMRAILRTNTLGGNRQLVASTATWKHLVGVEEPAPDADEEQDDLPEGPEATPDWVELHNPGPTAVSLAGWSLSDDEDAPRRWSFPTNAVLAAGGHLLVLCDGLDITQPATNGLFHASFSLDGDGETVVLTDPAGVSSVHPVPGLTPFQSWGRGGGGAWMYQDAPSPGAANAGAMFASRVAAPTPGPPAGIYATAQTVSLATATAGAVIRYTLDGTEPTESSTAYATPLAVAAGTTVRARAFKAGELPSATTAATYVIEANAGRRNLPALSLSGDMDHSLYRRFGIMSLVNGSHAAQTTTGFNLNANWVPGTGDLPLAAINPGAYNLPMYRGRFSERPVQMELFNNGSGASISTGVGLRVAGSSHTRPRYKLTDQNGATPNTGVWTGNAQEKPSFNAYFRKDFGVRPLRAPFFPGQPVQEFESLRIRAGKNDISNPFIRDEHARRLWLDLGQAGSRGFINTLYVNGVYKGYFNTAMHLKEGFFQTAFASELPWDVIQVTAVSSGDNLALQETVSFLHGNSMASLANYQAMATRVDLENFADYIVLNLFTATGDWPHNNYVVSRERSASGRHRFHVWDAEGVYGSFTTTVASNPFNPAGANSTAQGVVRSAAPQGELIQFIIRILYTYLADSPEFRLLVADRVQRHLFDGGALVPARVLSRWDELKADMANAGVTVDDTHQFNAPLWVNGKGNTGRYGGMNSANRPSRYTALLQGFFDDTASGVYRTGYFRAEGLWPDTRAPAFSLPAGAVSPGTLVSITHTNTTGTIYFTTDGRDPRAPGGAVQGTAYTGPLPLNQTLALKARVLRGAEWSPLQEKLYAVAGTPPLLITEIMYNPPDAGAVGGSDFEFIEIKNTGAQPVALGGMSISNAFAHTFADGVVVPAGGFAVLARTPSRFSEKYPSVPVLPEGYGPAGNLANGGERLTLVDAAGQVVFSVEYGDAAPWPDGADGLGYSLVPVDPGANPAPEAAASWRASSVPGGSPGADDPPPGLSVRINEVLSNPPSGQDEWVELHNPGTNAVDVGNWWLSDSPSVPKKFRLPAPLVLGPGGFALLGEAQFNAGATPFSFSAGGDEAVLSAADAAGNLTGYAHQVRLGAAESGRSLGWHRNSQDREFFVAQSARTPGAVNAGPRVGPVVLTEIMAEPAPGLDEYVELRNQGPAAVVLADPDAPARTWRLDGLDYAFPTAVTLQPRQVVLVASTDPAAFRAKYAIPPAIRILGPYPGSLNNSGERVAVQMPGKAYTNELSQLVVPYIDLDEVAYDDAAPWPDAGGNGAALERMNPLAFGDDPANWRAAPGGNPGVPAATTYAEWTAQRFPPPDGNDPGLSGPLADPDGDGLSNLAEWGLGLEPRAADYEKPEAAWIPDSGQTYLGLTQRRSRHATGLGFHADTASTAQDWSLGSGLAVGAPVRNDDGSESQTWRDIVPLSGASTNRLLRLRITSP